MRIPRSPGSTRSTYAFAEKISRLRPHQVLAINRGERQGALKVRVEMDAQAVAEAIGRLWTRRHGLSLSAKSDLQGGPDPVARSSCRCSFEPWRMGTAGFSDPPWSGELRSALTEEAEEHAIGVFARNLRKLLLQPPAAKPGERHRHRSGLPHRLQSGGRRPNGRGFGGRDDLPAPAAKPLERSAIGAGGPGGPAPGGDHRHRKRHRLTARPSAWSPS